MPGGRRGSAIVASGSPSEESMSRARADRTSDPGSITALGLSLERARIVRPSARLSGLILPPFPWVHEEDPGRREVLGVSRHEVEAVPERRGREQPVDGGDCDSLLPRPRGDLPPDGRGLSIDREEAVGEVFLEPPGATPSAPASSGRRRAARSPWRSSRR